ncbi:hypothetical protein QZH41_016063 [Actinostola sp. cb2023]|nr:hypothetical protein QZH41_016063 [Actinostola sp. cb2023]
MPKRKAKPSVAPRPRKRVKAEETHSSRKMSGYEKSILENIRRNKEVLTELNITQIRLIPTQIAEHGVNTVHRSIGDNDRQIDYDSVNYRLTYSINTTTYRYISYKKLMQQLKVKDHHVTKVVPERIFSLTFHDTTYKTLLFVGDRKGHLGLWDIDSKEENNVFVYEPHTRPVVAMVIDPHDNSKLFTCSYDGTIRCADFNKTAFDEVCVLEEDEFTYMAYGTTSSHTLIASTADGQIKIVDCRKSNGNILGYQLHDRTIKCLDVHPINTNIFATSVNKGILLWDARKLKGPSSCLNVITHHRSVSSAFFSPITGQQLLATSMDNLITIGQSLYQFKLKETLKHATLLIFRHGNQTGRWLSTFHAKWDPKTDTCFAVGSMKYPRQVDIFSAHQADALTHLQHENFTTITSRISFHPSRYMIAAANSSGKVYLWSA